MVPNLTTQRNALQMLSNRTQVVLAYVQGVADGTMKSDPEVLRMISGLMAGLPIEEAEEFREEFLTVSHPFTSVYDDAAASTFVSLHALILLFLSFCPACVSQEYADVQLTSYLATLTKSLHSLNNVRPVPFSILSRFSHIHSGLCRCSSMFLSLTCSSHLRQPSSPGDRQVHDPSRSGTRSSWGFLEL